MDEVVEILSVQSDVQDHKNCEMIALMMTGGRCSILPCLFEADDDLSSTLNHSHPLLLTQLSIND